MPMQSWEGFQDYMNTLTGLIQAMGPIGNAAASMTEQLKKMKGFPLANTTTTSVMGRKSTTTSEVTSIKEGPIPASAWAIPADYKRVQSPMAKARK